MDKLLYNRVTKSLDENIILIFFSNQKYGYIFYVLGKSDFIYRIVINKFYQKCNCEDFMTHKKVCKHICFILFKVLKVYRMSLNNGKISLITRDSLFDTNFFKLNKFEEHDWIIFKSKINNIGSVLKQNFFNKDYYKEFRYYYQQYYFLIHKNMIHSENDCPICYNQTNKGINCPTCKNCFHIKCLNNWFEKIEIKKCPICQSDYWNVCYKYFLIANEKKIPKKLILSK